MRSFILFFVAFLAACARTQPDVNVTLSTGESCNAAAECGCPAGYEADCEAGQCLCLRTETEIAIIREDGGTNTVYVDGGTNTVYVDGGTNTVYVDGGTRTVYVDSGPPGCQTDDDCTCNASVTGPYEPSCSDGVCFCNEVNRECHPISRIDYVVQLMDQLYDPDVYIPPATATFDDVPVGSYGFQHLEMAVAEGIIDASLQSFRPSDGINRAEVTKMLIVAIDGLAGYTSPAVPNFADVDKAVWYYDYVEAAFLLGLTRGYVTFDGLPSGFFGPGDTASTCFVSRLLNNYQDLQEERQASVIIQQGTSAPPINVNLPQQDVALLSYQICASIDVQAQVTRLILKILDPSVTGPVVPGYFYEYLTNIRILDQASGNSLAGPLEPFAMGTLDPTHGVMWLVYDMGEDYVLSTGTCTSLLVLGDLTDQLSSGYQVQVGVTYGDSFGTTFLRDLTTGNALPSSAVRGAGEDYLYGNLITIN